MLLTNKGNKNSGEGRGRWPPPPSPDHHPTLPHPPPSPTSAAPSLAHVLRLWCLLLSVRDQYLKEAIKEEIEVGIDSSAVKVQSTIIKKHFGRLIGHTDSKCSNGRVSWLLPCPSEGSSLTRASAAAVLHVATRGEQPLSRHWNLSHSVNVATEQQRTVCH